VLPIFSEDKRIINTKNYAACQRMFSEAGEFAVREAKAKGLPITYVEDLNIVKEYSDGRKEILGTIKPPIQLKTERYYRTMKNIYESFLSADRVFFFDNSDSNRIGHFDFFAEKRESQLHINSTQLTPQWFDEYILKRI
jgi:hypothetical protein